MDLFITLSLVTKLVAQDTRRMMTKGWGVFHIITFQNYSALWIYGVQDTGHKTTSCSQHWSDLGKRLLNTGMTSVWTLIQRFRSTMFYPQYMPRVVLRMTFIVLLLFILEKCKQVTNSASLGSPTSSGDLFSFSCFGCFWKNVAISFCHSGVGRSQTGLPPPYLLPTK